MAEIPDSTTTMLKRGMIVFWIAAVLFALPPLSGTAAAWWIVTIAKLTLLAHVIELAVFWKSLQRTGDPPTAHVVPILLFGIIHYNSIRHRIEHPS